MIPDDRDDQTSLPSDREPVPLILPALPGGAEAEAVVRMASTALMAGDAAALRVVRDACLVSGVAEPWVSLLKGEILRLEGVGAKALEELAPVCLASDTALRGMGLVLSAAAAFTLPDVARAHALATEALATLPPESTWGVAMAHLCLGNVAFRQGDLHPALVAYDEALDGFRRQRDIMGQSKVLGNIASALCNLGDAQQAREQFAEAIQLAKGGNRAPHPLLFHNSAVCHWLAGDLSTAFDIAMTGSILAESQRQWQFKALLQLCAVLILLRLGRLDEAGATLAEVTAACNNQALGHLQIRCQILEADLVRRRGDRESSYRLAQEAIRQLPPLQDDVHVYAYHFPLARIYLDAGNWAQAAPLIEALVALLSRTQQPWWLAKAYLYDADLHAGLGEVTMAEQSRQTSRGLCERHGCWSVLTDDGETVGVGSIAARRSQISCFGRLDVIQADGTSLFGRRGSPKAARALGMLLLEPSGISSELLLDRLYGEADVHGPKALGMLMKRLRQALALLMYQRPSEPAIRHEQGRFVLSPLVRYASEWWAFEQIWATVVAATDPMQRLSAYERLVTLYQGRLFGEWYAEPWALVAAESAHQKWQHAYASLQQARLARRDHVGALALIDANLAIDPLAESVHAMKIRLLLQQGDKDGAVRQYEALARLMATELGSAPSPETWALVTG